jgi:hypothetical protein
MSQPTVPLYRATITVNDQITSRWSDPDRAMLMVDLMDDLGSTFDASSYHHNSYKTGRTTISVRGWENEELAVASIVRVPARY